ncbi:MAG: hypothetical protein DRN12_02230 [Thermoplasmata archaeon]|nr:MAG: hypothetical protein DRN12_02230 [Thermoplasmata archaeon]
MNDELKAGVGLSRKWDAREAGREVAETTLEKLDGENPKFFLLFSTIHYEKYGGFQELLNGVWDVLPEGTPLVGGTVLGFANNFGCYTRGASALAVSYKNMDVAMGYGKKSKNAPIEASNECAEMIDSHLKTSQYRNAFLLNLISGPELFNFPGMGQKKIIESKTTANMGISFMKLAQRTTGKGLPRDDEILKNLTKKLPEYSILSGVLLDDFKFLRNYQFYDHQILINSLVGLGLKTDLSLGVNTTHGMLERGDNFKITKVDFNGWLIKEINNKPAWPEFLRLLGWNKEILSDENKFIERMMYSPLGFKREGQLYPAMPGIVLGDSMMTVVRSQEGDIASIMYINGELLLQAVKKNLEPYQNWKPSFALFSSCITRLITLGKNIYYEQNALVQHFQDTPFLVFYVSGEGTYSSERKHLIYSDMSFNSAVFRDGKGENAG